MVERMQRCKNGHIRFAMFLLTPLGRIFDQVCIRNHTELDQVQIEEFCEQHFPIPLDNDLMIKCKAMINKQSSSYAKYEKLLNLIQDESEFYPSKIVNESSIFQSESDDIQNR